MQRCVRSVSSALRREALVEVGAPEEEKSELIGCPARATGRC
jgi:hypothetical protein